MYRWLEAHLVQNLIRFILLASLVIPSETPAPMDFLSVSLGDLAEQLTLYESKLYSKVSRPIISSKEKSFMYCIHIYVFFFHYLSFHIYIYVKTYLSIERLLVLTVAFRVCVRHGKKSDNKTFSFLPLCLTPSFTRRFDYSSLPTKTGPRKTDM